MVDLRLLGGGFLSTGLLRESFVEECGELGALIELQGATAPNGKFHTKGEHIAVRQFPDLTVEEWSFRHTLRGNGRSLAGITTGIDAEHEELNEGGRYEVAGRSATSNF